MSQVKTFEDLECWKSGREVRLYVSKLSKKFPKEETYVLKNNMKRAAYSITNNIAEGYGRFHYKEYIQYCRTSRGSLYEVLDQLIIAFDEEYISESDLKQGRELIEKALALTNGFINYLEKQKEKN